MKDLFEKCFGWQDAKMIQSFGVYPYFRPIESTTGSTVVTHGKRRVMIGSNNYLGLAQHPRVEEAAKKAIDKYGTGCTGSRLLNGNLVLHEDLEHALAAYLGKEACAVFSTGFLANQGTLSCLMGRRDVIYSDMENHASIIEGSRIAVSDTLKFRHNDMDSLEALLQSTRENYEGALIVADGVFSMSGDIIELPRLVQLAKRYNCRVYIDDAHSIGVLGSNGQGTEAHFNMDGEVDLIMGTFSKTFASIGGFVAGNEEIIHYLKHQSRTMIFSAAMPPASVATVLECLKIMQEEPEHHQNLLKNTRKMATEINAMGYNTLGSKTPIIPLLIGDDYTAFNFTQKLYEHGVFATPVIKPAVPEGCALIRTSYMASHTDEDLDYVLGVLETLGKEMGILDNRSRKAELDALAHEHFGPRALAAS